MHHAFLSTVSKPPEAFPDHGKHRRYRLVTCPSPMKPIRFYALEFLPSKESYSRFSKFMLCTRGLKQIIIVSEGHYSLKFRRSLTVRHHNGKSPENYFCFVPRIMLPASLCRNAELLPSKLLGAATGPQLLHLPDGVHHQHLFQYIQPTNIR